MENSDGELQWRDEHIACPEEQVEQLKSELSEVNRQQHLSVGKYENAKLEIKFVPTNFFTHHNCSVCGGWMDKDTILCEGENDEVFVRVCPKCLKSPEDVDAKLERQAIAFELEAKNLRCLKGKLILPTFEQWEQFTAEFHKQSEKELQDWLASAATPNQSAENHNPWQ